MNKAYAEAIKKYPWWPANVFEGLCILNEEQGELAKALYDHVHAGQPLDRAIEEAAQTAAMSLRMLQQLLYLHPTGYKVAPKKRGPYNTKRKKLSRVMNHADVEAIKASHGMNV